MNSEQTIHGNSPKTHRGFARREGTDADAEKRRGLDIPWYRIARLAWIGWATFLATTFLASVPIRYSELINSHRVLVSLQQLGIAPDAYAAYSVGLEVFFALGFFTVGLILFRSKRADWLSLYVAAALVTFGVGAAPVLHVLAALSREYPMWDMPVSILAFMAWSGLHIFTYIFPDGKLVARWTLFLIVGTETLMVPWFLLPPDSIWSPWSWHPALLAVLMFVVAVTPATTQIYRYVHSTDQVYRQQVKWVVFGLTAASLGSLGVLLPLVDPSLKSSVLVPATGQATATNAMLYQLIGTTLFCVAGLLTPATIGISIMRYRLWAIDLIINRTLVYVPLTGILAGLYAASVTLFQKVFMTLTGARSDAAVVMSTLILASLFTPIKDSLQRAVDKRFKDTPDPTRKLKAFGQQVQSVVQVIDPQMITRQMLDEVTQAFGAQGGAIYVGRNGYMSMAHNSKEWDGEAHLSVPLQSNGERMGMVALGPRHNGMEYSDKDRKMLQDVADMVAEAMRLSARNHEIAEV